MNDTLEGRVRAAAVATWWTVLIGAGYLTLVWLVVLALVSARPAWYRSLLGPGVSWEQLETVTLWAVAIFKMCLWLIALVAMWLTLWARQLRRQGR
jgi:hypothetical protein